MWSPFADSPPRSVAPASTSSGHQSRQVRRDLDADVRHQPPALLDQALDVLDRDRASPTRERRWGLPAAGADQPSDGSRRQRGSPPPLQRLRAASIGDLRHLGPVVPRVRDEVLEDHLLEVAVALVQLAARASSDSTRSSSVSPMPTRIPLVKGICSSPAASIVARRCCRMLGRGAGVDGLHQALGDRLQHQALGGGHLAQPSQVLVVAARRCSCAGACRAPAPVRRPRRRRR